MRKSCAWAALAILTVTVGVAASAEPAADQSLLFLQDLDQRTADISWRIAAANVALCPQRVNGIGFSVHDAAQYAPSHRQAAIDSFGFGDGLPAVLTVARGGPADLAGLRAGDRIVAIDGGTAPPSMPRPNAKEDYGPVSAVMARLERLPGDRPVALQVKRGGADLDLILHPVPICRSRVEVVPSAQINANSDGLVVQIYGKLALWTQNHDELATIIAHEMAHNILDHNGRIEREGIGTGLFAGIGRDGRKLRDMEREADRYGLFMVARAGYDYHLAPDLWRRLANTSGLGAIWATTHPSAGSRAEFNREVVAAIDLKKSTGSEIAP